VPEHGRVINTVHGLSNTLAAYLPHAHQHTWWIRQYTHLHY